MCGLRCQKAAPALCFCFHQIHVHCHLVCMRVNTCPHDVHWDEPTLSQEVYQRFTVSTLPNPALSNWVGTNRMVVVPGPTLCSRNELWSCGSVHTLLTGAHGCICHWSAHVHLAGHLVKQPVSPCVVRAQGLACFGLSTSSGACYSHRVNAPTNISRQFWGFGNGQYHTHAHAGTHALTGARVCAHAAVRVPTVPRQYGSAL